MQIGKLMELKNNQYERTLLALANPDIPRIRCRVNGVSRSLDQLGFIQLWVQEDKSVVIKCPVQLQKVLIDLVLIKQ